jgi:SAM-dependent methyltransferase
MDYDNEGFYAQPMYYDILFGWDRSPEILFVDSVFQKHGLEVGAKILEVACGTGVAAIQLQALGWSTSGLDISQTMIRSFKERCRKIGRVIPALCADMTEFEVEDAFDGAYCPLGSIGLLSNDEAMLKHLVTMGKNIVPGGLYLVDLGLNPTATAPCDLMAIEWVREHDGILVEAIDGRVRVDDPHREFYGSFEWEDVPLEYFWPHFESLVEGSKVFEIEAFYPESGHTEEGISLFDVHTEGTESNCDRAMVLLRRINPDMPSLKA